MLNTTRPDILPTPTLFDPDTVALEVRDVVKAFDGKQDGSWWQRMLRSYDCRVNREQDGGPGRAGRAKIPVLRRSQQ